MIQDFKRKSGDAGGPADAAIAAHRDMNILHDELLRKAVAHGLTVYSVSGAGQAVVGNIGAFAPATGGFAFPFGVNLERQFGQGIQVFGSRYLLEWQEERPLVEQTSLDISTSRQAVRLISKNLR